MKILLLLISYAFILQLNAQELTSKSSKADSLAYYEAKGDYKTILTKKLFDHTLNKNIIFISEADSLQLIDSLFADEDYRFKNEAQIAIQTMILNGDFGLVEEEIHEVFRSYPPLDKNPNYMENSIVQKNQILIEYFSLIMEQLRASEAVSNKFPYYDGMSSNTKVEIVNNYKENMGIGVTSEEALQIVLDRLR